MFAGCGSTPGATGWSAVTVDNNSAFVGGADGRVYAVDANTGAYKWAFPSDKGMTSVYSTPIIQNNTLYVGAYDGGMRALDPSTGALRWQFPAELNLSVVGPIVPTPLVANNTVFFGDNNHKFYALDAATGTQKWTFSAGNKIWSGAMLDNGTIYFGSLDHFLYALDANTGAKKWAYDAGGIIEGMPLVENGTVYFGALNKFIALDAATGTLKWEFVSDNPNEWIWAHPTASNNAIYFGTLKGNVYALDKNTGTKLWMLPIANTPEIRSSIVIDGDTGYFGASDLYMYKINLSNGQLILKSAEKALAGPIYATPTLQNGVLYIQVQGHTMYALNASDLTRKWCFDENNRQACGN